MYAELTSNWQKLKQTWKISFCYAAVTTVYRNYTGLCDPVFCISNYMFKICNALQNVGYTLEVDNI